METVGLPAASWVVGKALSPLSGGVLEAWGASSMLGPNMEALKLQLLYAQAMLNNVRGREIHNPALGEMLDKLRQLAYGAEDVLDELDYFRIQDELDGTYHAADAHAAGCVQDLALNVRHTARSCVNKLKFPVCSPTARRAVPDKQHYGGKQGCLSGLRSCGRRENSSSPPSPANQQGVQEVHCGCMPKAAHNVGKYLPCCSLLPSVDHDAQTGMVGNSNMTGNEHRFRFACAGPSKIKQTNHETKIPKLKFDRVEMSRKILEITEQLKPVCAQVFNILNLEIMKSSQTPNKGIGVDRPKTSPQIIEPKLYGREHQKDIVIGEIVKSECCELTVLPIVGPGGIGKTTFTQHIYEQMKSHFHVPIWICVSLDFDANRLAKDILKKIPEVNNENKNCSAEELIKQRLKGKRVLLVLDDVWQHRENEWEKLKALFKQDGAKGNMVIVTTRIPGVANTVKTTKCLVELDHLCPKDIKSFFEECVFGDQKPWADHPKLSDVGSKIVDKLKGSPLAAKTVGRLLRNKLTLNHWRSVLESKEWESQTSDDDIMPALKLSYDYLPFHLQKCFSFCALFPEDYGFGSEELVHLWIGLDILRSYDQKRKRIEDVGLCYLNELVNHGFFKMNKKEDGRPYYVIHDLLHELAVNVSSHECISIYSSNARDIQIPPTVRHLSIIVDKTDVKNKMSFEDYDGNLSALAKCLKVENLHTIMLFGDYHGSFAKTFGDLFREARALRIILLSEATYNMEDILHNFSKLVHLRYLRIKSKIYQELGLPSSLFRLYHLQVIDLKNEYKCFITTRNLGNLVKLRHFLVPKESFKYHSDIYGVGKLKFLHELKEFRVGKESKGFELSQLGPLREIGGSLHIYNVEKVQTKEEANDLKLIHKNHIRELMLEWDATRSNRDPVQEENVLESLVPHWDLQKLSIKGHGGSNCPTWLCANLSVKNLESLCLDGVSWKNLPPVGELWMVTELGEEYQDCSSISPPSFHNLKKLELKGISILAKWVGNDTCPFFSHLEVLIIKDCSKLMELPFSQPTGCQAGEWEEKMALFPKLHELVIEDCPNLESLPPIPWRAHAPFSASIERVGSVIEQLAYGTKYRLKLNLQITGKDGGQGDVFWNALNFSNLTDLKELHMNKIPPLPLDDLLVLTSLKVITISNSSSVLLPVEGEDHGSYQFPVEDLEIITSDTSGKELTLLLSFLPNLSKENGRSHYVIHDLLHELAVKVSSYECVSIYSSNARDVQIPPTIRHLSIIIDNTDVNNRMSFEDYDGNLSALGKKLEIENLRTLMLFGDYHGSFAKTFCDLFKEARALRVISLSKASYNVEDMLQKFSELVHLRYLRIESVDYWRLCLPRALFRLYHLEVIDVQNNDNYVCSTRHMSNLIKLRHFLVPKVQYDICGVGKLKFLQELKEFRVGKESEGFELSQLGALTEIGGSLGIYNLEKVQTKEEANELKLIHKNHVRELTLEWDARRSNKDPVQEENVLASLVPHCDLQELCIKGHGGTNCPAWLCANLLVKNLESLCLDGVSWKNFPPVGEFWLGEEYQGCSSISPPSFHNLKKLELNNISNLTKWVGNGPCPFFSRLEVLVIKRCFQLMELPFCESSGCQVHLNEKVAWFPKLCELVIEDCPNLESLPPIPWHARADAPFSASIERVGSVIERLAYGTKYGRKLSLRIEGKDSGQGDVFWNALNFSNVTGLEVLHMNKIPRLPLDDLLVLTSLKVIMIFNSSSVLLPVEGESHGRYRFPVEDLGISKCDTSGKELTLLLSFLPNLSTLTIRQCENITALGVVEHAETVSGEQQQQTGVGEEEPITAAAAEGLLLLPPLLQELAISHCPKVSLLPNPPPDDHAEAAARGGREGGLRRLRSLRLLHVFGCPEFLSSYSSSSSSFPPFPTCLQHLALVNVKYMETMQALSDLTSLTELTLNIPGDSRSDGLWPLLAHGRLTKLALYEASDFFAGSDPSRPHDAEVFSSSSKLVDLETRSNTGFLAAPICSLFSSTLTRLELSFDEEVERLTNEQEEALQLLTSLQELDFWPGKKLQRLPAGLHKLISLKKLMIAECSAIRTLPRLPSSLQELEISHCGAIKSLPNTLPSSLERLEIFDCGAIKSLPKDGLPSSMLELVVYDGNSEELKRECRKLIGTIPIIRA